MISHPDKDVMIKVRDSIKEGTFLNTFIPMPEELRQTTSPSESNSVLAGKYGASDWYEWAVNNWGTKWDISEGDFHLDDDGCSGHGWFNTAWAPPIEAMRELTEQGFDIDLIYWEPGCSFAGHFTSEQDDNYFEYDFTDPDWRDSIYDKEIIDLLESEYAYYLENLAEEETDDGA
jgi:hypothetical protein